MASSPPQTVWQHIDLPLWEIKYQNVTASGQGKGSTTWAAHSHTPVALALWDNFDALVTAEGQQARNLRTLNLDLEREIYSTMRRLNPVSREEDVTNRLESLLSVFADEEWHLAGGSAFAQQNQQIIGKPDLVAQDRDNEGLGVGPALDYRSPARGDNARVRRENTDLIVSLYRFPFETKPVWKFRFLNTTQSIIDNWEVPRDFDSAKMQAKTPLPKSWSQEKQKVFHLVRQVYGQMVSDHRRYGILTTYEHWFFLKRSQQGVLKISRSFARQATGPSVFQAIKTMLGFEDHELEDVTLHPQSATKVAAPPQKRKRTESTSTPQPLLPPTYGGAEVGRGSGSSKGADAREENLAALLDSWDCQVYDVTDTVLLLTTRKDPTVLVKMQSDPQKKHVADEMAHEAAMYAAFEEGKQAIQEVIPRFRGHSSHLGVAMTCTEREGDDFDDIGLENVSGALKQSAVRAVEVLSTAGVLHNDLELRNMVQSRNDPCQAKIIDFGRASFSSDRKLLEEQVERVKFLLNMR